MSDGQTVTILFYNPDSTPSKLLPNDTLTSWKWILNSRDVTAVLQPETGKDANIPTLASRIMQLVEKNHNRFMRNKAKIEKENAKLADLTETVTQKENIITELDKEIAEWQAKVDELVANPVSVVDEPQDEPVSIVSLTTPVQELDKDAYFDEYKAIIKNNKMVYCPPLQDEVELRSKSGGHILNRGDYKTKFPLLKHLPQMVKTAFDKKPMTVVGKRNIKEAYRVFTNVQIDGKNKVAGMIVFKDNNNRFVYDMYVSEKNKIGKGVTLPSGVASNDADNPAPVTPLDKDNNQTDSLSQEFFADDDVMLDSIGSKMVLNLFIFDENGNEIDDLVQDEPQQPAENPQNNDIATQDEFLATAKSLGFDDVRKEVYPTNDGELVQFMIDQHFDEFNHQKDDKMYGYAEVTLYTEFTNDKVISRMIDDGEVWRIENNPIKGLQDFKAYIDNIKAELTKQMNEPNEPKNNTDEQDPSLSYLTDMANGKIELTVQNMKEHILKLKEIAIALDGKHDDLLNQAIEVYQQFALSVKVQ